MFKKYMSFAAASVALVEVWGKIKGSNFLLSILLQIPCRQHSRDEYNIRSQPSASTPLRGDWMYQKAIAPISEREMDVFRAGKKRDWKKQSEEQRNGVRGSQTEDFMVRVGGGCSIKFVSRGAGSGCVSLLPAPTRSIYARRGGSE